MDFAVWSEDIMNSWKQAQQQYWNNISGQPGTTGTDTTSEIPGFTEGLEKWWTVINPLLPEQSHEAMKRVFDMGKSYSQFLDDAVNAKNETANPLENWLSVMENSFKEWSEQAQNNNTFSQLPPGMDVMQGWQSILDNLKNIPEEKLQDVAGLAEKYGEALQAYIQAFSGQGLDSLQALRQRMEIMATEEASISSLRELYELWIDVGEETYRKFAMSQQHQEIYGDLVNTFTALKGGMESMIEPQLKSLNILTQKDLDEVLKQLQQVKRENEALRGELSDIREQLTALKTDTRPAKSTQTPEPAKPKPVRPALKTAKSTAKPTSPAPKVAKPVSKPTKSTSKPASPAPKATKPAQKPAKPEATEPDDLTTIKGIGPKMSDKLIDAGIQTFGQLAALSTDQAEVMDKQLDARGRLLREDWVGQAAARADTKLA